MLGLLLVQTAATGEWPHYGLDAAGSRYVRESQVNRENVSTLEPAWTYRTGEVPSPETGGPSLNFECTPIMVKNRLILSTPRSRVIALNPETGEQLWKFDPKVDFSQATEPLVSRGVAGWNDRIFFATYDARLVALNQSDGMLIPSFGRNGVVDLKPALGRINPREYSITSPPAVIGNLVVVGSCITDNARAASPSGVVRAFDALTGKLIWSWNPLGSSKNSGSANAWSIMSVDTERGLIFVPTGSAAPDFFGGHRPGENKAANSVTALDAKTGVAR